MAEKPPRPAVLAALAIAAATLVGLLNAGIVITSDLAESGRETWRRDLVVELDGAYTALVLVPFVVLLARRFRLTRASWLRLLPLHVLASMVFGASHTLLMWGTRTALFRLLGWGRFGYGDLSYRFLMEYQKQAVIYVLVYGFVELVAWQRRGHERELRTLELERELSESRLAALRLQLNPHFLFNTLNMISSHVREKPEVAEAMIGHLADFLRLLLRQSAEAEVPLDRELTVLDAYLAIMRARFEDRLSVTLSVEDAARGVLVPQLLLQPLVENAVTHGAGEPGRPAVVRVSAARRGDSLRLTVEDDGPGLTSGGAPGIGLANTKERLRTLHGAAGRLELDGPPTGGLRVLVEVPWRTAAA